MAKIVQGIAWTGIAFLIKAIVMRFVAVRFHRGSYYRRIRSALQAEFIVTRLLTGPKRVAQKERLRRMEEETSRQLRSMKVRGFWGRLWDTILRRQRQLTPSVPAIKASLVGSTDVFTFDGLPMTEQELCNRSPFSNHKLAVFVEFIKENDFSYGKGVFRDAICEHVSLKCQIVIVRSYDSSV
jgi:hypothetical protein